MSHRRFAACAVSTLLLGGLLAAPAAVAASPRPAGSPVVGHVVYFAKDGVVREAAVAANGTADTFQTVGPVTVPKAGQKVQVSDLVASGDGDWVAWEENVTSGSGSHEKFVESVLVLRDVAGATNLHRKTTQAPVGFAGDALVTTDGDHTKTVDLQPSFHFDPVTDSQFPLGTYPDGVVDGPVLTKPAGPRTTWEVRLTTFKGAHTVLHSYVRRPTDYQLPDAVWTSGDGKHLAVELGNHQDFGGLGPSSLLDEYSLTGAHHRSQLGHYGTPAAQWRVASVSYAGPSDTVWAAWERPTKTGATGVVATFSEGNWQRVASNGIAVAASSAGYVVVQSGKFVEVGKDFPEFNTVPTANAVLVHGATSSTMNLEGSAFVWVS
jgi:hypothetical protein